MGDPNQLEYLRRHVPSVAGPVLEIGSHNYGNTQDFRSVFVGCEYVGLDMQEGPGVDLVLDLTTGIGPLKREHFELAICCSVLEHVRRPWVFSEHLTSLVQDGGILYMAVPWVWRFHPFPDDFWRFSPSAVRELFPAFEWKHELYTTNVIGETFPVALGSDDELAQYQPPRGRKYLPYLMLNMIGYKDNG
jgi:hypothetical protein